MEKYSAQEAADCLRALERLANQPGRAATGEGVACSQLHGGHRLHQPGGQSRRRGRPSPGNPSRPASGTSLSRFVRCRQRADRERFHPRGQDRPFADPGRKARPAVPPLPATSALRNLRISSCRPSFSACMCERIRPCPPRGGRVLRRGPEAGQIAIRLPLGTRRPGVETSLLPDELFVLLGQLVAQLLQLVPLLLHFGAGPAVMIRQAAADAAQRLASAGAAAPASADTPRWPGESPAFRDACGQAPRGTAPARCGPG